MEMEDQVTTSHPQTMLEEEEGGFYLLRSPVREIVDAFGFFTVNHCVKTVMSWTAADPLAEEALLAYDRIGVGNNRAALLLQGARARLNFPQEGFNAGMRLAEEAYKHALLQGDFAAAAFQPHWQQPGSTAMEMEDQVITSHPQEVQKIVVNEIPGRDAFPGVPVVDVSAIVELFRSFQVVNHGVSAAMRRFVWVRTPAEEASLNFHRAPPRRPDYDLEAGGQAHWEEEEEAKMLRDIFGQAYAALLPASAMSYSGFKDAPKHVKVISFGGLVIIWIFLIAGMLSRSLARRQLAFRLVSCSAVALLTFSVASQLSERTYVVLTALVGGLLNLGIMLLRF